jgi:hypothetical protein
MRLLASKYRGDAMSFKKGLKEELPSRGESRGEICISIKD